ncbi:MAG: hypothetical protein QM790_19515 [Nibricoccus sp.]
MQLPPLSVQSLVLIDEGLDILTKISTRASGCEWTSPLTGKSRSLQRISRNTLLAVTDFGYVEIDDVNGEVVRTETLFQGGVISAQRMDNGNTFFGGLNLTGGKGVSFVDMDSNKQITRSVCFGGDYVRCSTLTPADTILFTSDNRVYEGDWAGGIIREFTAAGFKHAWKARRLENERTLISAGYGAFVAEFDLRGNITRRWECSASAALVRPHFFSDFSLLQNGNLVICNWLGHGRGLGGTGYPLLEFTPTGELIGGWQDRVRTSSPQTFVIAR